MGNVRETLDDASYLDGKAFSVLEKQATDIMLLRRLDADKPQDALEDELHQLLRLAHDIGKRPILEQDGQCPQTLTRLVEVAMRKRHAGHSWMISPRR